MSGSSSRCRRMVGGVQGVLKVPSEKTEMLETLKGKLHSVQRDFSSRIKSSTSFSNAFSSPSTSANNISYVSKLNLDAGAEILKRYQENWNDCHEISEGNVFRANNCSKRLMTYEAEARRNASQIMILNREVSGLPRLTEDLRNLVALTSEVQGLCEEINSSLSYLELLCDTQKQQEEKLDLRFQLALYREKRVNLLNEAKDDLALEYIQRVELKEKEKAKEAIEKQKLYQQAFEQDVQIYKTTGFIANSLPPLEVTKGSRVPETLPELRDIFLSSKLHGLVGQNLSENTKNTTSDGTELRMNLFSQEEVSNLQMFLRDCRLEDSGIGSSDYHVEHDNEN